MYFEILWVSLTSPDGLLLVGFSRLRVRLAPRNPKPETLKAKPQNLNLNHELGSSCEAILPGAVLAKTHGILGLQLSKFLNDT